MPYGVIVVSTNGSRRAAAAVNEAFALAKLYEGTVHGVDPGVSAGFADSRSGQFQVNEKAAQAEGIRTKLAAEAQRQGVPFEFHMPGKNDPADAILEVAASVNADLVVVGNQGMSGMKRVLGSAPNKVSHKCPCSVLIVNTEPN
jgi:nucleotide-binding universal stress UspA family protein